MVHRPQNDPLIHDESSNSRVFRPLAHTQAHKFKSRNDLESELFDSSSESSSYNGYNIRDNEGEAAEYGVYFDDTEYDYMQHIRELNSGDANVESFFVEAKGGKNHGKAKTKMSLEDALRESSLQDEPDGMGPPSAVGSLVDSAAASSSSLQRGVEAQQDVPDALAGFQPDMDPRLKEVLEALDDDAYVDDEEEVFGEIARDRQEVSLEEFQDTLYNDFDEDEDGWESDVTEKPQNEYKDSNIPVERLSDSDISMLNPPLSNVPDVNIRDPDALDQGNADWMKEFSKFKQDQKATKHKLKTPALDADLQSSVVTGGSMVSGRKKRKGALTSSTGFSMTSSALARTEGLTTLDRRFDKIEEEYADDGFDGEMPEDTASIMTKSSTSRNSLGSAASSQAANFVCGDFDNIMDEFLGGYQIKGKRVKKGGFQTGMEQLDELRKGLGPAKVNRKATFI